MEAATSRSTTKTAPINIPRSKQSKPTPAPKPWLLIRRATIYSSLRTSEDNSPCWFLDTKRTLRDSTHSECLDRARPAERICTLFHLIGISWYFENLKLGIPSKHWDFGRGGGDRTH